MNKTSASNMFKLDYGTKMKVHKYNKRWKNISLMNERDRQRQYSNERTKQEVGLLRQMVSQSHLDNRVIHLNSTLLFHL